MNNLIDDKYRLLKEWYDENIQADEDTFQFIKNNFEYVGENFTHEARLIHYDNKKKEKNIYGTATKEDLKDLSEEGIDVQTIPWIEDTSN